MKTILEAVQSGTPIDFTPFIDVHGHFGPWPETTVPYATDCERVIAEMDRYGCQMVWMSASNPGYADDMALKNDIVFDFARKYPGRILPYCTLSANRQGDCATELKRCLSIGPCIGVKMHLYKQPSYTMESGFLQPVFEILQQHRLVYMNHGYPDCSALERTLPRYPELIFIAGHFSPGFNDMALRFPNLLDCTCAAMTFQSVEKEVLRLGRSDTMLVGSDFNLFQLGFGIGMIAFADIAEEHKRNILGRNAQKLLERMASGPRSVPG